MAIVSTTNRGDNKPDVYDVLKGESDKRTTPISDGLTKGPDSPQANDFAWHFEKRQGLSLDGSPEGRRFAQANTSNVNMPGSMKGVMHYFKDEAAVGEVTAGDQVYGLSGASLTAYLIRQHARKAMLSLEAWTISPVENQPGSKDVAYKGRGLETLISPAGLGGADPQTHVASRIPDEFRPSAEQCQTLTVTAGVYTLSEKQLTDPFNAIYAALGAKMDMDIWCTVPFKNNVSNWGKTQATSTTITALRRFNANAADKIITATIDTYVGDTGTARFELHPMLRNTELNAVGAKMEAVAVPPEYAQYRVRFDPGLPVKRLPDQAAGDEFYFRWMMGIQVTPKFCGKWSASA